MRLYVGSYKSIEDGEIILAKTNSEIETEVDFRKLLETVMLI